MKELELPDSLSDVPAASAHEPSLHPSLKPVAPLLSVKPVLASPALQTLAPLPPDFHEEALNSPRITDNPKDLAQQSITQQPVSYSNGVCAPGFILLQDENSGSLFATCQVCFQALREVKAQHFWREFNSLGVRSLPFLCLVLSFVGAILVYQAGIQALRLVPDTSQIGPAYLELLVRDLAATLTGLMLATRVGAGIAAEIGSMKVTDQLDALRLSRADPIVFLVAPKLLASMAFTPLVTLIGGCFALGAGVLTGTLAFDIRPASFFDPRFLSLSSIAIGLLKAFTFGVLIPIFSAHAGLYCLRGSQGVGNATTRAVVSSSLGVIIFGFIWGVLGHVILR